MADLPQVDLLLHLKYSMAGTGKHTLVHHMLVVAGVADVRDRRACKVKMCT